MKMNTSYDELDTDIEEQLPNEQEKGTSSCKLSVITCMKAYINKLKQWCKKILQSYFFIGFIVSFESLFHIFL